MTTTKISDAIRNLPGITSHPDSFLALHYAALHDKLHNSWLKVKDEQLSKAEVEHRLLAVTQARSWCRYYYKLIALKEWKDETETG